MKQLLVFPLTFTVIYFIQRTSGDEQVKQQCTEGCSQVLNDVNYFDDLKCNTSCRETQCQNGCDIWRKSANNVLPCSEACNSSGSNQNQLQFCTRGCNLAMDIYAQKINATLGALKQPTLVPGGLSHSSVILHWEPPIDNLTYHLQGKFAQFPDTWKYFDNVEKLGNENMLVKNLRPYVQYKFQVMVVITPRHLLETPESYAIQTLPFGVPASPPKLTSISVESPTVIQVSWQPPMFPSGPLVRYDVELTDLSNPDRDTITKDIGLQTSCTFTSLKPSTQYSVSIAAVNMEGLGPAVYGNITTSGLGNDSSSPPFLVFSAAKTIYRLNMQDIIADPEIMTTGRSDITATPGLKIIYNSSTEVQGAAVHVWKQLAFFSDKTNSLSRLSLIDNSVDVIYTSSARLSSVTVDWLNDQLCFVEGQNISCCSLEGSHCKPVVTGLILTPTSIYLDPYHDKGYLYWTQGGMTEASGMYRVTLTEISTGPIQPTLSQHLILQQHNLSTMTVDLQNFFLYYPNNFQSSLMKANLDGTDSVVVRKDVSMSVQNLIYFSGTFYMSDQVEINFEEYDSSRDEYFYNEVYRMWDEPVTGMSVLHTLVQPVPVPSHWPTQLQVIFSSVTGVITWRLPSRGFGSDSMSHHLWFTLMVSESRTGQIWKFDRIQNFSYTMENLQPNATYSVKIRASSDGGNGPWSPTFIGKTLFEGLNAAKIAIANPSGLYLTNAIGRNLQWIINTTEMEGTITDISCWGEHYILSWSTKKASLYNTSTSTLLELGHVKLPTAIAVDWIGEKLYWSSLNSVIYRSNLNGSYIESVYQLQSPVRDLAIDSAGGFMYWNTHHTVECSRLNGDEHFYYVKYSYLAIPQALGLTLDLDKRLVYWLVVDMTKSCLYSASMASGRLGENPASTVSVVSKIEDFSRLPVLHYFQGHIYFLDDHSTLTVGSEKGDHLAKMLLPLQNVSAIKIMHPSLGRTGFVQKSTDLVEINVLPAVIPKSSIYLQGNWTEFEVIWTPDQQLNYGSLFYEVALYYPNFQDAQIVSESSLMIRSIPPYTSLNVTVRPYTYWHTGLPTSVTLRTPMGVPGEPSHANAFVSHKRNVFGKVILIAVEFHWRKPERENGVLIAYHLTYIIGTGEKIQLQLPGHVTLFKLNGTRNEAYSFQVQACTYVGCGKYSDQVVVNSSIEVPPPKLLLQTASSIRVFDADRGRVDTTVTRGTNVVVSTYIAHDGSFFWVDALKLFRKNTEMDLQKQVLHTLVNPPQTLTADWVARILYWADYDDQSGRSSVWSFDLNRQDQARVQMLYQTNQNIKVQQLLTNPLQSKLSWLELYNSGMNRVVEMDLKSNEITQILPPIYGNHYGRRRKRDTNCNCPMEATVGPAVAMLVSENGQQEYYWVDTSLGQLLKSDSTGCMCQLIANSSVMASLGFTPSSLSIDREFLYLLNETEERLYLLPRVAGLSVQALDVAGTKNLVAFGEHLQPMPDSSCLLITNYTETPVKLSVQSSSIALQIPPVRFPVKCDSVNLPTVQYQVYYGKENGSDAKKVVYGQEVTISGLEPYTNYTFQVAASNYYSAPEPDPGPLVVFKTSAGTPSEPVNVKSETLTPKEISVSWEPPLNPHGPPEDITYSVMWRSLDYTGRVVSGQTPRGPYIGHKAEIENLTAAVTYSFQVLAYDQAGEYYSISKEIINTTFEYPGRLKFENSTSDTITISWMSPQDGSVLRHRFRLAEVKTPLKWKDSEHLGFRTKPNNLYSQTFQKLTPNTEYAFRVRTMLTSRHLFEWPTDASFTCKTTASVPGEPIPPKLTTLSSGAYEVFWYPPEDFGSLITQYRLEYMPDDYTGNWSLAYKGVNTKWTAQGLDGGQKYIFRVAAYNAMGWGPFSSNSSSFFLPVVAALTGAEDSNLTSILVGLFAVIVFLVVIAGVVLFLVFKKRNEEKRNRSSFINNNGCHYDAPRTPDIELATLRELPRIAYHTNTTLYGMGINPSEDEIAALPHFRRDQLTLTQLLGSGAFGEVYEGEATDVLGQATGPTKVAVKVLSLYYYIAALTGAEDSNLTSILVGLFAVIVFLVVIAGVVLFLVFKKRNEEKRNRSSFINNNGCHYDAPRTPDIELATLRELPRIAYHTNTTLYGMGINPSEDEVAALPHFRRDQLTLTQLLGSGAFGEVYEGEATDVLGQATGPTKVAVKTLRRGANDSEKEEFLKEALLMSNFKHNHILRLLGVCLDNDPQFIILELMDCGDLLSFLRATRPSHLGQTALTFPDLISICCDVSKGCSYLEDLHFVHRDIAARNCLVSWKDNKITVKIGDFGLARDIYRNDYYRKEGEGLLPVRWMSPEALIDGVFTTQSDVWAYGVLVWEVLTLGQQPYPARTNLEVLQFVRGGGRLDRPENCPDELHDLTLKCWSFNAKDRPTFHHIEERLIHFMELSQVPDSAFSGTVKVRRLSGGCFDNPAFAVDVENNNKYQQQQQLPNTSLSVELPAAESGSRNKIGGSVKLTPTSKRKRLQSLIGDADLDSTSESTEVLDSSSGDISQLPRKKKTRKVKKAVSMDHMHAPRLQGIAHRTPSNANDYLTARHHSPHRYLELLPDGSSPGHQVGVGGASAGKVNYSQVVNGLPSSTANMQRSAAKANKAPQTVSYAQLGGLSDDNLGDDTNVTEDKNHKTSHSQLHSSQDSLDDGLVDFGNHKSAGMKLNYATLALGESAASGGSDAEESEIEGESQKLMHDSSNLNYADLEGTGDDESDKENGADTDDASGSGSNSPERHKERLPGYENVNFEANSGGHTNSHSSDRVRYANLPESDRSDNEDDTSYRKPLFKEPHPNKNRKIKRPHGSNSILVLPDYSTASKKKDNGSTYSEKQE
ncbi:proto-oncogene tyrosine-protein kinase ROS [Lingula anatina]|uniref:Tyrosine-protein kinase receptor n=1 Tax=Lingula anatina TaxID=7574 RepID=A0A1S3HGI1_LINAN|nr:proto-oncogene tyrosine-protein kinase ROS [Lingula anatina]|eukprot:XP_013384581.1 proto-oncogene tyrosine-protein kinase ROS [Lingula anatina]